MLKEGIHYEFFVSDKGGAALDRITGKIKNMEGAVKKLNHEHGVGFDNMTKKTNKLKAGIGELAREFPLLGQAIRLATSPLVFVNKSKIHFESKSQRHSCLGHFQNS